MGEALLFSSEKEERDETHTVIPRKRNIFKETIAKSNGLSNVFRLFPRHSPKKRRMLRWNQPENNKVLRFMEKTLDQACYEITFAAQLAFKGSMIH